VLGILRSLVLAPCRRRACGWHVADACYAVCSKVPAKPAASLFCFLLSCWMMLWA
jgi:hypothetical protein